MKTIFYNIIKFAVLLIFISFNYNQCDNSKSNKSSISFIKDAKENLINLQDCIKDSMLDNFVIPAVEFLEDKKSNGLNKYDITKISLSLILSGSLIKLYKNGKIDIKKVSILLLLGVFSTNKLVNMVENFQKRKKIENFMKLLNQDQKNNNNLKLYDETKDINYIFDAYYDEQFFKSLNQSQKDAFDNLVLYL